VTQAVLPVYAPKRVRQRLGFGARALAMSISLTCLAVLMTAVAVVPSADGIGTHAALGLARCGFEQKHGLPCGTCGMTTSFAWFVRGRFFHSAYVQPFGFLLAGLSGLTFWASLYVALSGRPAHRLLGRLPVWPIAYVTIVLFFAAWGWKIFLRGRGLDG